MQVIVTKVLTYEIEMDRAKYLELKKDTDEDGTLFTDVYEYDVIPTVALKVKKAPHA